MQTHPLAAVKANLSRFVDAVLDTHERVLITRNGVPAAVLISPSDLDSLEETLAGRADPEAVAAIRAAEAEMAAGVPGATLADLESDLRARRQAARLAAG